jgi:hypothetical protein
MEQKINAYKILVGKREPNRPLGRPRLTRENNKSKGKVLPVLN